MGAIVVRNTKVVPILAATLLIYCVLVFVFKARALTPSWLHSGDPTSYVIGSRAYQKGLQVATSDPDYGRVSNRTLGFEKVLAIGLKERSDKRDALSLMSALTGFEIEWVDSVKPHNIPDKAVPYGIDAKKAPDNFLGGWRGHMNALRR